MIVSSSLNSCSSGSNFTATLFNVAYTPKNNSVSVQLSGVSSLNGNVTANIQLIAYGFTALNQTINPCDMGLMGFCPLQSGQIPPIDTNFGVGSDIKNQVPGIAFTVPDLDGVVRIYVKDRDTGAEIACMEADISNTKSVYHPAVGWTTAIIAGLGLIASGVTSGLGHTNTAAHVAANAVSLFGLFQAQAIVGLTAVHMPPIVQSWTQNFAWSMGIIRVGFLQTLATWYQRATGGTPSTYLSTLSTYSVQVQKRGLFMRSLDYLSKRSVNLMNHAATHSIRALSKRQQSDDDRPEDHIGEVKVVRGIERVGFRAKIEQTNIFMTGVIFFIFILMLVAVLVALAKVVLDVLAKRNAIKADRFSEFRAGWKVVIKGILFRLVLLGYVQMSILCLWEFVARDSAAEIVLALVIFLSMSGALAWASYKVISLARKSVAMHKNPAYILYSDPQCLNKWGFLYVQYKATAYYFVVALLGYILFKAVFIAFAQSAPVAQAVGLLIIEAVALIAICVIKPFMDKKTNIFNICIAVVNFLNAIFLLIFSDAFGQPPMVSGVMGVIFAFYNMIFAFVLLIMVLVSSIYAITSKNPETRYQPMRDDRGSFIKSQQQLTTELDALGATARGTGKEPYGQAKNLEDSESMSTDSLQKPVNDMNEKNAYGHAHEQYYPADNGQRGPDVYAQRQMNAQGYNNGGGYGYGGPRPGTAPQNQSYDRSISPPDSYGPPRSAHGGYTNPNQFRQNNNSSPWQRGAGYD